MTDKGKNTLVGLGILGILAWLFTSSEENKTIDTTAEVMDEPKQLSGIAGGRDVEAGGMTFTRINNDVNGNPRYDKPKSKLLKGSYAEKAKMIQEEFNKLTTVSGVGELYTILTKYGVNKNGMVPEQDTSKKQPWKITGMNFWDSKGKKYLIKLPDHIKLFTKLDGFKKSKKKLSGNDIIYLKDFKDVVFEEAKSRNEPGYHYSDKELTDALNANVKDELRYNLKTGKTYNKHMGKVSEFTNKSDIIDYDTPEEAAKWGFTGFVRNSASRVKRGYSAI